MNGHLNKYFFIMLVLLTFSLMAVQNKSISQDLFDDSFLGSAVTDKTTPKIGSEKTSEADSENAASKAVEKINNKAVEAKEKTAIKIPSIIKNSEKKDDAKKNTNGKDPLVNLNAEKKTYKTVSDLASSNLKKDLLAQIAKPSVDILGITPSEIFRQMADLERENALLNLEIQRQKLQTTIEEIERGRRAAEEEENAAQKEAELKEQELQLQKERDDQEFLLKQQELENEQKKIFLADEKDKYIATLKKSLEDQRRVLMERINDLEKQNTDEKKIKEAFIKQTGETIKALSQIAEKKIVDVETVAKMSCPVCKVCEVCPVCEECPDVEEILEQHKEEFKCKSSGGSGENGENRAADLYSIVEIKGQNDDLIVRLATAEGLNFFVKKGTVLNSGHIVKDIKKNQIVLEKDGQEEIIAFPVGGIMAVEPASKVEDEDVDSETTEDLAPAKTEEKPSGRPTKKAKNPNDTNVNVRAPFTMKK
ncbi:MAG: hypothetical protein AB7U85_07065 [Alphaproteobacteria bacterium]